ncbi:MAG: erythromycin esterase family protein [Flavobacteriaceae bacterium]|nr:erythromycin esterase family protein [Flavobacteriaceae bacterium]
MKTLLYTFILFTSQLFSQNLDFKDIESSIINLGDVTDEDFTGYKQLDSLLQGVEIVMLGEQSHGEGTVYETKIKLIKYLHKNLGFEILAFESGFYDCKKAWDLIEQGEKVDIALAESVFYLWSTTKEFRPLVKYIEENKNTNNSLQILGFDSQFSGSISEKYFLDDLSNYLNEVDSLIVETDKWKHLKNSLDLLFDFNFHGSVKHKEIKKNNIQLDTVFINNIIKKIELYNNDIASKFWIASLKSAKVHLSDLALNTNLRDQQMADNLIRIKEMYPNKKIICWGATSHFLYNSKSVEMKSPIVRVLLGNYYKSHLMMGDYIKEKYKSKVFTIGFTAYQGNYGLTRNKKIKEPKSNTLEYLLGESEYDNFLMPLLEFDFNNYNSRPLGNYYMKNDISNVMDAVIFNRYMKRPRFDSNLFLKIYPDNKYIKPELETELKMLRYVD